MTKFGRAMPPVAARRSARSMPEPRRRAEAIPVETPSARAHIMATVPSKALIGSDWPMMSLTVKSR